MSVSATFTWTESNGLRLGRISFALAAAILRVLLQPLLLGSLDASWKLVRFSEQDQVAVA